MNNPACAANISPCERRRQSTDNVCLHYPIDDSGHRAICEEYWDRGLDCPCVPEDVKQAIRNGASPEEVM